MASLKCFRIIILLSLILLLTSPPFASIVRGQQTELSYDDGSADFGFRAGPGAVAAVKFAPLAAPSNKILKLKFYIWGEMYNVKVHVLNRQFSSIYSKTVTPSTGWFVVDISSDNVYVSEEFYVGWQWLSDNPPWLGVDNTPPHNGRSYLGTIGSPGSPKSDEDYMIRAIVTSGGEEVTTLTLGQWSSGSLSGTGDKDYFKVQVEAGKKLIVDLDGPSGPDFDLYIKYGSKPTTSDYEDRGYTGSADERVQIASTQSGWYYIMVNSYSGSGSYNIKAYYEQEESFIDNFDSFDTNRWYRGAHSLGRGYLDPNNVGYGRDARGSYLVLRLPANTYDGAEIGSNNRYKYGTYRVRMECPQAPGSLSTFFLYQDIAGGNDEIDIEIFNDGTRRMSLTIWVAGTQTHSAQHTLTFDPSNGYHEYQIDFYSSGVRFYVDGQLLQEWASGLPTNPMRIMSNTWWPTWLSGSKPATDKKTYVDWIEYSQAEEATTLTFGQWATGSLGGTNDKDYFKVQVEAGKRLIVDLDGPDGPDFDLYIKYGSKPTTSDYEDRGYTGSADERVQIASTQSGWYYIMVNSYSGSGSYRIKAYYA
jgi:beta-glucanase (GH16 family)